MEITDVRVRRLNTTNLQANKMRAIVSITLDNEFVVHDIKVIQGTEKLFIAMPSRKMEDGTYQDIAHPIKAGFRDVIQTAIFAKYEEALAALPREEEANAEETYGETPTEA
ncbi:MAG: septation regulator SpoVG [Defluviitaleaceae bacterium]|nr:septation regulator SpoVG [Defluviitaleaceae bacterium]